MSRIVKILMRRDGLSLAEAKAAYRDGMKLVREEIAQGNFTGAEDIFMSEFGLEPDYLLEALI